MMTVYDEDAGSIQISVRVRGEMVERADALVAFVSDRTGRAGKRSDVWREALMVGLRELERQAPPPPAAVARGKRQAPPPAVAVARGKRGGRR